MAREGGGRRRGPRVAKTLKRAPSALDARARMMTRWRAAWLEGMDADEGEPRERAVEEGNASRRGSGR